MGNMGRTTSTSLRLAPDRLRQFPPGSSSLHITLRIRTRSSEATGTNSDAPSAASRPSLVPDASLSPELEGESSELTPAADGPSPEVYHPADHSGWNPADPGRYLAAGIVPDNYEALLPIPRHHQELPSVPDASSSRATSFPANLPGPRKLYPRRHGARQRYLERPCNAQGHYSVLVRDTNADSWLCTRDAEPHGRQDD